MNQAKATFRQRALELLLLVLRLWRPKNAGPYFAFRAGEELERERADRAIFYGQAAVASDPARAITHLALARAYEVAGRLPEARRACEDGVRLAGDHAALTIALARLLRAGGEDAQALAILAALVRDQPTHWAASSELSRVLHAQGRSGDALRVLEDYRARVPEDPRALGVQAGQLLDLGREDEALPLLLRQSEWWPDDALLHSPLAQILWKQGDLPAAGEHARRARDLWPDHDYFSWLAREIEEGAGRSDTPDRP